MRKTALLAGAMASLLLSACNTLGPQYKNSAPLEGIVSGPPRVSQAPLPPPMALTIGLIASDATELTLDHLTKAQKQIAENPLPFTANIRAAAASYDPRKPVAFTVEMLRSRFARVQLIPDMNALASLPQPAIACVLDLRYTGINDLAGQRVTATSDLLFLDGQGAVAAVISGRSYNHLAGGNPGQAAQRAWMTLQSSTVDEAMADMRAKLDARMRQGF